MLNLITFLFMLKKMNYIVFRVPLLDQIFEYINSYECQEVISKCINSVLTYKC